MAIVCLWAAVGLVDSFIHPGSRAGTTPIPTIPKLRSHSGDPASPN